MGCKGAFTCALLCLSREVTDVTTEPVVTWRVLDGVSTFAGIVVLPFAFSRLGLAGGSIALGVAGLLAFLSAHLLLKASHAAGGCLSD